jgi:carbamoyl-phosphate synthase large subunit
MIKKNILITAVGGRSVGSGILHALLRADSKVADRWNVIAADADPFSWGLYKVSQRVILPMASHPHYLQELQKVVREYNIDAVIPGSEPEVFKLAKIARELDFPIICNRAELIPLMENKFLLTKKLAELGLPTIETWPIEQIDTLLKSHDFPIIVKPTSGTGGSRGLKLCKNRGEIQEIIDQLPANSGYCVQPYVGGEDAEYTAAVLTDFEGEVIDSIIMKRKLIGLSLLDNQKIDGVNYPVSTGYSQGFFVRDEKIQQFIEDVAVKLESTGPLNIQFRIHKNESYIFEVHPRFSGTTAMRADVGYNEVDVLLRNKLWREKFGRLNYQSEVAVIRAFEHVVVKISDMLI